MGIAVTAVGCFLMGLPHFLTGLYQWGQNDERICRKEGAVKILSIRADRCEQIVQTQTCIRIISNLRE